MTKRDEFLEPNSSISRVDVLSVERLREIRVRSFRLEGENQIDVLDEVVGYLVYPERFPHRVVDGALAAAREEVLSSRQNGNGNTYDATSVVVSVKPDRSSYTAGNDGRVLYNGVPVRSLVGNLLYIGQQ